MQTDRSSLFGQLSSRQGAWRGGVAPVVVDGCSLCIAGRQHAEHRGDILVADHAEDDLERVTGIVEGLELGAEVGEAAGVMPRVAQDTDGAVGIGLQCLPSSAQVCQLDDATEALFECFGGDCEAQAAQLMHGRDDGVGIAWLTVSAQGALERAIVGGFVYIKEGVMAHPGYLRAVACKVELRDLPQLGILFEGEANAFIVTFANDTWHALFHDAGFLGCNLWQRVTKELGMIERDIRDDAEHGLDDVGRVETTAQSHFDDCDIDLAICKVAESHHSGQFEERRLKAHQ